MAESCLAFLRMDNPGKKELVACVKETTLVSSGKVRGKKTTCNFAHVLHGRPVGMNQRTDFLISTRPYHV